MNNNRHWKSIICLLALFLLLLPTTAEASSKPARSTLLYAGPYLIEVDLSQDPPFTDQPFAVTVLPHDTSLHLTGTLTAEPGQGTDATPLKVPLQPSTESQGALIGSIHLPVRGAWDLVIDLNGPQGHGATKLGVTVGSPGAMPVWLGWLIGMLPLLGIIIWFQQQRRYRRRLLAAQSVG